MSRIDRPVFTASFALAIGLFGVSEILINLEKTETIKAIWPKFRDLIPRMKDVRDAAPAIGRASIIGFIFGVIPGVSHVVSTFVSYAVEKRCSKYPEKFGTGVIEGVAGPEAANNATASESLFTLKSPVSPPSTRPYRPIASGSDAHPNGAPQHRQDP